MPYRTLHGGSDVLDAEYRRGKWSYLWGLDELARFSVVAGYCHHLRPGGTILEVGCGEGILQQRLDSSRYSRYVGIDISAEAIQRARRRGDEGAEFICADASAYDVDERFDVIIFNECLEYFSDPLAVVRRYERALASGGVIVISMFQAADTDRPRRIWRRLQSSFALLDETRVENRRSMSWTIRVLSSHRS